MAIIGNINSPDFIDNLATFIEKVNKIKHNTTKGDDKMTEESKDILKECTGLIRVGKNLILTGAPGTGKTHLAREIAEDIIGVDNTDTSDTKATDEDTSNTKATEVDTSSNSTDIPDKITVEDIKKYLRKGDKILVGRSKFTITRITDSRVAGDCGNPDFTYMKYKYLIETHDLIVKGEKVCASPDREMNEYYKATVKLIHERITEQKNDSNQKDKVGDKKTPAKNVDSEKYKASPEQSKDQIEMVQFHPSYDYTDFVEGLRPTKADKSGNIGFELRDGTFKAFCKKAKAKPKINFVFIIDEINRGEISKIFGELFFSIDPGYRGEKGRVKTQYANLIDEHDKNVENVENNDENVEDVFKDGFYIPENVYIIGTMNDIDRSVECIDFAFRRRFAWKNVEIEDTSDAILSYLGEDLRDDAKRKLYSLNAIIENDETLGKDYCIGASYLLKLRNFDNLAENTDIFQLLWDYHLKNVIYEYYRGLPASDIKEKMKIAEEAFLKTKPNEASQEIESK